MDRFPPLRPAYAHALALWVHATLLAHSACESAPLAPLAPLGKRETTRQRLRDLFRASADKRVPTQCDWDVTHCFAPLLCWLLSWWRATDLALALDATSHGERLRSDCTVAPPGGPRRAARLLVAGPGHAWVGTAVAFKPAKRQAGTVIVVWEPGHAAPWVLLTNLAPAHVGVVWYGLRVWVELGFKALKRLGWQWQRTQRSDPDRVARQWLILAIATLWTVAVGTRVEEATARALCPTRCGRPPRAAADAPRTVSVFAQGWGWLVRQGVRGRLWARLWLLPEPWPTPPAPLTICYHAASP